ncbi:MAG: hypothetical protein ABR956_13985 [Terracidiphilus sp.]|jgi:hypothetical protein
MRTVRNITVAVEPELYRQTRKIAADYDTTVTDMVRFLLIELPEAVKAARYPGGRPQFVLAAYRRDRAAAAAAAAPATPSAAPAAGSPTPPPERSEIWPCMPVNPVKQLSLQQLVTPKGAPILDEYFSMRILKSIIKKVLRAVT